MKTKILLSGLLIMMFTLAQAQDIPPGGIPGFPPDNNGCPPGAWCHPDGAGMSVVNDDDIDAINDALENPKGCCCACALGKAFIDLIKPLYPDCYPNCNMEESSSSESGNNENQINKTKAFAAKGEMSMETYNYLKSTLPRKFSKSKGQPVKLEEFKGAKIKLGGMWVYNEKEKNEFRVLSLEPVDHKSGVSYDRLYVVFDEKSIVIMNQSWINEKEAKKK